MILTLLLCGAFWLAVYSLGGIDAMLKVAAICVIGVVLLALNDEWLYRKDRGMARRRLLDMRENDALNRILGRRRA